MAKKNYFVPVDLKVDFSQEEKKMLEYWRKEDIYKKYLNKNKSSKKIFSFLDGPITANNPMGVHHAWGRTYKDIFQKYKNLKGFKQRFQNGFDCQGLWVEVEVEKELGIKSKKDIENLIPNNKKASISKFVDLCKDRVKKYSDIQTQQSKRLEYFMDWDNSYFTLSENNNYMIWHFLKVCHENGWIYKGADSVPWCPRCETAISQHEILTEDYQDLTHESIIMTFPIVGKKDEYLLVWTTTPWTIPANIAVAVDKNLNYVQVQGENNRKYWLVKEAIDRVFGNREVKTIKQVKGKDLVGLKYKTAFDHLPAVAKVAKNNLEKFHIVIATDDRLMPISVEEGTGLVHTAVSAGTEDYRLGQKLSLPMIPVIADNADYLEGLGFLTGKNAKDNPRIILDYLKKEDEKSSNHWVFSIFKYKHRYPCCWRCKSELVWKVTDEWYIAMDTPSKLKVGKEKKNVIQNSRFQIPDSTLRERMKNVTKKIKWIPKFGLKRELDWLNNMGDWLISKKNRYWGLALPIWECSKCSNFEVIGSYEELEKRVTKGWKNFKGKTPHKPQIDELKIECSKCKSVMNRIEPVGNPWLDAGIVAYSTVSENNQACLFSNSKEKPLYQTDKKEWSRWIPADFITESFPGQFKNWFYSLIAMSSVLENINPFKQVLGFATLLDEKGKPMHKSLGNMIEFNDGADKIGVDVMRWMYVRQNPTENLLFGFHAADDVRRKFHLKLWNIYNFFVTYSNLDNWFPSKSQVSILNSQNILDRWILSRFKQTVDLVENYLDKFDAYLSSGELEKFVDDFSLWYIRRSRERVGPFAESKKDKDSFYQTCYFILENLSVVLSAFVPVFSEMIYINLTKKASVNLANWPEINLNVDQNLISEMKRIRKLVEEVHSQRKELGIPVRQPLAGLYIKQKNFDKDLEELLKAEVNVKKVIGNSLKAKNNNLKLDTKITPSLLEEAKARDLARNIQNLRKEQGLKLLDKRIVIVPWIPENPETLAWLQRKTSSKEFVKGDKLEIK